MTFHQYFRDEINLLQGNGRGKALVAVSAGSLLITGVQMVYSVLLPELRLTFDLGLSEAGLLLSALWVAYAAGQMPGGWLTDRIGDGATMFVGTALVSGMLVAAIATTEIAIMYGATIGLGIGAGFYGVSRFTVMEEMYPDRVGTTIGIVLSAADAGQALLPPIASFLAVYVVWQLGFAYTVPFLLLVCVALWVYVPSGTSRETHQPSLLTKRGLRAVRSGIGTRSSVFGAAIFTIYASTWVSFTSLYPTYLVEVKELSKPSAAVLFGLFFALGVVVKPLAGALYDRFGVRTTLGSISLVSGGALAAVPQAEGIGELSIATALIAPILGSGAIAQSYLLERLSAEIQGVGFGLIRTGGMAIAGAMPALFGIVAERGNFDHVFFLLAGLAGALVVLATRTPPDAA